MEDGEVSFGPFRLDTGRRQLRRGDMPIRLGSRAMGILCALVAAKGQVVSKDALMQSVWAGVIVEDNAIQVHVSALRKALETADDLPDYVVTVPGRGYRFVGLGSASPGVHAASRPMLPDRPSIAVLPFENLSDGGGRRVEWCALRLGGRGERAGRREKAGGGGSGGERTARCYLRALALNRFSPDGRRGCPG